MRVQTCDAHRQNPPIAKRDVSAQIAADPDIAERVAMAAECGTSGWHLIML